MFMPSTARHQPRRFRFRRRLHAVLGSTAGSAQPYPRCDLRNKEGHNQSQQVLEYEFCRDQSSVQRHRDLNGLLPVPTPFEEVPLGVAKQKGICLDREPVVQIPMPRLRDASFDFSPEAFLAPVEGWEQSCDGDQGKKRECEGRWPDVNHFAPSLLAAWRAV